MDSEAKQAMKLLLRHALVDAETAHKQWETDNLTEGHSDPDWPSWYAQYLVDQMHLTVLDEPQASRVRSVLREQLKYLSAVSVSTEYFEQTEDDDQRGVLQARNRRAQAGLQRLIDLFAP